MEHEDDTLRGRLLIASAALLDPNFHRTVVLVTEHNEEGAMGVVLNRPSSILVADAVPKLVELVPAEELVFVGGPVQPEAVVALGELDDPALSAAMVFADVGFLPPDAEPAELATSVRRVRVFAGYAGWSPGQLETELEEEAWIVEPAEPADVLGPPDGLWSTVLTRKGGAYAILARMPDDPSVN